MNAKLSSAECPLLAGFCRLNTLGERLLWVSENTYCEKLPYVTEKWP